LRFFQVSENRAVQLEPMPAIFPGYQAPVVRLTDDGESELVTKVTHSIGPERDCGGSVAMYFA
jgi:hypothetical protein